MIATCPACGKRYRLPDDAVPAAGRNVRCAACGHGWIVMPDGSAGAAMPAPLAPVPTPPHAAPAAVHASPPAAGAPPVETAPPRPPARPTPPLVETPEAEPTPAPPPPPAVPPPAKPVSPLPAVSPMPPRAAPSVAPTVPPSPPAATPPPSSDLVFAEPAVATAAPPARPPLIRTEPLPPPPPPRPVPPPDPAPVRLSFTEMRDAMTPPKKPARSGFWLVALLLVVVVALGALAVVEFAPADTFHPPRLGLPAPEVVARTLPDLPPVDLKRLPVVGDKLDRLANPPPAPPSPLRVTARGQRSVLGNGTRVMTVTGTVSNPTDAPVAVERIDAALLDHSGRALYRWRIDAPAEIAPHASASIESVAANYPAAATILKLTPR